MVSTSQLPSISVVVPSLDQGRYLGGALESIFRQRYPSLEVLVMDGGSTDGSVDVIGSHGDRLAYWQSRPDGGQSAAINEGVRRSRGDLVAWLNADDEYVGDALWIVGRAYAAAPGRGLYIGNGFRWREGEGPSPFCRRHLALDRDALTRGLDYLLQPAVFVLREAWNDVGGLAPELTYCMDWDLFIRVARRYPAVLINEFIALSREYAETKTRAGGMARAMEIDGVARRHSGEATTPGSLYYLLETMLDASDGALTQPFRHHVYESMEALRELFRDEWGNADGFPEAGDPQDTVYLPLPTRLPASDGPSRRGADSLPSISIVTPSFNQAPFLERTLRSVLGQGYPRLETLVIDGGSTDGSVDLLRRHDGELSYWVSEPDRGPANAVNKGLSRARGEILGWLNSDDLLALDAVWEVAEAFAADPELDMVFGNALYIDADDELYLADHGAYRTGLYFGELQAADNVPFYWTYVHAIPQPTVFFRRSLLERCGPLNETYQHIFDFELFWRLAQAGKTRKLERTLAFYRIHARSKTGGDWRRFQVEHYAFSRPRWPRLLSPTFYPTLRSFVSYYMRDRFGSRPRGPCFWGVATLVALSALTGVGNPERWSLPRPARSGRARGEPQRAGSSS